MDSEEEVTNRRFFILQVVCNEGENLPIYWSSAAANEEDRYFNEDEIVSLSSGNFSFDNENGLQCKNCHELIQDSSLALMHKCWEGSDLVASDKLYTCSHCPFNSPRKHEVTAHSKVHYKDKPHGCPYCPYRCVKKWDLKNHIRIHTGEKPFQCPYCPHRSALKMNCDMHIAKKHSGMKTI